MIKKVFLFLVMVAFIAAAALEAAPAPVNGARWYRFVYQVGTVTFIDYVKLTTIDAATGRLTAVNEYGTKLSGFRRKDNTDPVAFMVSLETDRACYYLDTYVFKIEACMNPRTNFWHHGSFRCKSAAAFDDCPTCEPLCSSSRLVSFTVMKKTFTPFHPSEKEEDKRFRKWRAEKS